MRRKGIAQPWWGGQNRDMAYHYAHDLGLHERSLRELMQAVTITTGPCESCKRYAKLYDGLCYCCYQHSRRRETEEPQTGPGRPQHLSRRRRIRLP